MVLILILILILLILLLLPLLVDDTLGEHIVVLGLGVGGVELQRLLQRLQRLLEALLRQTALAQIAQRLGATLAPQQRIVSYALEYRVGIAPVERVVGVLVAVQIGLIIGVAQIIEGLVTCRIGIERLDVTVYAVLVVVPLELSVAFAHRTPLGQILSPEVVADARYDQQRDTNIY